MFDRRRFLQGKLSLPLWGGWFPGRNAAGRARATRLLQGTGSARFH